MYLVYRLRLQCSGTLFPGLTTGLKCNSATVPFTLVKGVMPYEVVAYTILGTERCTTSSYE